MWAHYASGNHNEHKVVDNHNDNDGDVDGCNANGVDDSSNGKRNNDNRVDAGNSWDGISDDDDNRGGEDGRRSGNKIRNGENNGDDDDDDDDGSGGDDDDDGGDVDVSLIEDLVSIRCTSGTTLP